ncbi:8-amino-7-oxononanoate synthase [Leptolyngbya sp. 'hensonii']|uniref:8-amino-7-oxononanoate synthase n=1 Tax=Leptolyngbya sp. 'hensonii' TaxID=1922337 RepID=UPI00095026D5|nr:8-amino-7-oxononanoate synthase [Leptolyngbya sp. 'hensonii']OLP18590.1 8-amino-7-oxononanoate synthase [Leptolyngbya sp. 'hensonii']
MSESAYGWIERALSTIHRAHWTRSTQTLYGLPGAVVNLDGQEVLNFASNDYLNLASDHRLIEAAIAATREFGTGSTGSRLLSGHRALHRQLEIAIADLKQTEEALVFSSGYLANLGTIAALVGPRDLVLSDQYNHSSLKQGVILSRAHGLDYAHGNLADLRYKLEQQRSAHRRCLILTDSVFSMDGDLCPLPELLALSHEFNCMVLIDEAHGTGVLGPTGAGCVEHFGCTGQPLIQMGTLSKALGSLGGYVAGSRLLIDFLRNRSPTWIYTTGLSPADTAAALAAVTIVRGEPDRRTRLWHNVQRLKELLSQDFPTPPPWQQLPSDSPILCLQVTDAATVLAMGQHLKQSGLFVSAIRPPTAPTSRIRLTVMSSHQEGHLQQLSQGLRSWLSGKKP